MRKDNELLKEIRRIERIKEIKNFIEKAPYQTAIIAVGIPFLLYYTFG